MIEGLKPYLQYKESGQKWLGKVPVHWGLMPNRALFEEVKDRNHPTEEMLSVTITRGIIQQRTLLSDSSKKDSSNINKGAYKLVQPGDIAYNKMRAWQGAVGASSFRGIISPAYVVMRPRGGSMPWFYHHLYRTPLFAKEAERWSYGIASDMWSLRAEHFKVIYSVKPSPDEQAAIVRFLDHANRKIDGFIRAKRKLIGLLNEQKQAIIHRAVTRGLNRSVRLKPSGVPWLDGVPEHWRMMPNRSLFRIRKRIVGSRHAEYQVLSLTKRGVVVRDMEAGGKFSSFWERSQEVRSGNIVFCFFDVDETPRAVGLSHDLGMISPDYTVMECPNNLTASFLELFYLAMDDRKMLRPLYTGLRKRISKPLFLASKTPIPPAEELRTIIEYVNEETAGIDKSSDVIKKEIALMQEYRTRLTADIVTGKLDVRDAAAKLPSASGEAFAEAELKESLEENELVEAEA